MGFPIPIMGFVICLNKQISSVSPSQLKSNVISLDHHISQYATICQQLQAEVRRPLGTRLGTGSKTQKSGVLLGFCGHLGPLWSPGASVQTGLLLFQVAALREKLQTYEAGAQALQQRSPQPPKLSIPQR